MERIGDHAADISEMTILMSDATYERSAINIDLVESMAKETTDMVIKCVDAFVNKDLELARTVIAQDDVVDDLFADFKPVSYTHLFRKLRDVSCRAQCHECAEQ